jgi:hypothetical protein
MAFLTHPPRCDAGIWRSHDDLIAYIESLR